MEEDQEKPTDNTSDISSPLTEKDTQTLTLDNPQSSSNSIKTEANPDSNTELSNSPKKQKTSGEITTIPTTSNNTLDSKLNNQSLKTPTHIHYQDISFNEKKIGYCSFSTTNKNPSESISTSNTKPKPIPSHPIQQILNHVSTDPDSDEEDEQKKKIAIAKKLLFPDPLATSFPEVADSLRNERRQEFCPIYKDETPEQLILRQSKQKPVGSLLAKRIRWDDLKRKREEEEKKAQMQFRYGSYGPIYNNQQQQQSFANPYEQYYTAMQNQYDLMAKMTHAQQEHSAFWPESPQQASFQNQEQIAQYSMQQPYTYPYPVMNSNNMTGINTNLQTSFTPADYYNLYSISNMQPPPPPPDEP